MATISKNVAELAKKLDKKKLELFCTNTYDIVHRKIPPRRQLDEIAALFVETFSELLGASAEFAILPEQALTLDMLEAMTLKERWAALDRHYSTRTSWEKVRTNDPTAEEMLSWIDANFPDREELMLVYGDLKRLDKSAYDKIDNWINIEKKQDKLSESNRLRKVVKVPEDRFGFPTKRSRNDRLIADGVIPTASEVYERLKEGDPRFRGMLRRYSMAQKRGRPLD